jgi:hypothetical protein
MRWIQFRLARTDSNKIEFSFSLDVMRKRVVVREFPQTSGIFTAAESSILKNSPLSPRGQEVPYRNSQMEMKMKTIIAALALFLLVGALATVIAQFSPAAAFAAPSEKAPGIIAAQLRRQGVACTTPRGGVLDSENSTPHETAWILRCDEASYRVRIIPHLGARIVPVCQQDRRETSSTPEMFGKR